MSDPVGTFYFASVALFGISMGFLRARRRRPLFVRGASSPETIVSYGHEDDGQARRSARAADVLG